MHSNNIPIHTPKDFCGMRKAGLLAAKILDKLQNIIIPGISTEEINFDEKQNEFSPSDTTSTGLN